MEFTSTRIQARIRRWVTSRLGVAAMAPEERATRFLEEALEVAQAMGVKQEQATRLVAHVYAKEAGVMAQELGAAGITLAACAESVHYLLYYQMDMEMDRIEHLPADRFQRRQMQNAAAGIGDPLGPSVIHGKTCEKVHHVWSGWVHAPDDDGPYDVDGVSYCGRCHEVLVG